MAHRSFESISNSEMVSKDHFWLKSPSTSPILPCAKGETNLDLSGSEFTITLFDKNLYLQGRIFNATWRYSHDTVDLVITFFLPIGPSNNLDSQN
jgi:hypothetical protein